MSYFGFQRIRKVAIHHSPERQQSWIDEGYSLRKVTQKAFGFFSPHTVEKCIMDGSIQSHWLLIDHGYSREMGASFSWLHCESLCMSIRL